MTAFPSYKDTLASGRKFRTANLKDDCTRECPAILVDFSLPGRRVTLMLDHVGRERGNPEIRVVDNRPSGDGRSDLRRRRGQQALEGRADADRLDRKLQRRGPRGGLPPRGGGRLRDECLDPHMCRSLDEARRIIEPWRVGYHETRPLTALRMSTPKAFAASDSGSGAVWGLIAGAACRSSHTGAIPNGQIALNSGSEFGAASSCSPAIEFWFGRSNCKSAVWRTDPASGRNLKAPSLGGGKSHD